MTGPTFRNALAVALSLCGGCASEPELTTSPGAMDTSDKSPVTGIAPGAAGTRAAASAAANMGAAGTKTATMPAGTAVAGTMASSMTSGAAGASTAAGTGGAVSRADDHGAAAGSGGSTQPTASTTGVLPVPTALDKPGPFEILDQPDTGPGNQFRLFAPKPMREGLKHPIVAWSPGAGAFPDAYLTLLNLLASQGFVTLSYNSTAEGKNLVDAIDWLLAENERPDSVLYGRLDTQKVAAGGHSAGSLATYGMADDPRLTTTLHMSGGSFNPQTDVPRLKKPALMVCGDAGGDGLTTGDLANPMCIADFDMAQVPVFFAVVKGAGHAALNDADVTAGVGTEPDDPKKALFFKAMIGWLRWQLADDQSLKPMFVGDDCELCKDSAYSVKQKNLK